MPDCHRCGAPVIVKKLRDGGGTVVLDRTEVSRGDHRFIETPQGMAPCHPAYDQRAYRAHEDTCSTALSRR